jgi:alpha-L-fucosidase
MLLMNLFARIAIVTAAALALSSSGPSLAVDSVDSAAQPTIHVSDSAEQMHPGPFEPTWRSLAAYEAPDWFRDAKFGIWAHWGPQCEPEDGDWYARRMYEEGGAQYKYHLEHYGHPSEFGFKDIIHRCKAENWDPQKLVALYRRAGAQYFFALANHHDNFDLHGALDGSLTFSPSAS